jgi:hypothetical protein
MVALTRKTGLHPYLKMARIVAASLPTKKTGLRIASWNGQNGWAPMP